jgi:hypothetical protein
MVAMSDPSETGQDGDNGTEDSAVRRPLIDVSGALHMAGHEAELLGLEGVPDTGPVVHAGNPDDDDDPHGDPKHRFGTDIATRGVGHHE